MNRVVLFEQDRIDNSNFSIKDRERLDHIHGHIKAKKGDSLKATFVNHGLFESKVIEINQQEIILGHSSDIAFTTPKLPDISLIVATSRPPTIKKVVEHGTTLGVKHFHFFTAQLSEKSYLQSKVLQEEKLKELALLGLSQSGKVWEMPTFSFSDQLKKAHALVEGISYILSLTQGKTLIHSQIDFQSKLNFFIGPERGWTKSEEEFLLENNTLPISLSEHILRVETAAFALLSQLEMIRLS